MSNIYKFPRRNCTAMTSIYYTANEESSLGTISFKYTTFQLLFSYMTCYKQTFHFKSELQTEYNCSTSWASLDDIIFIYVHTKPITISVSLNVIKILLSYFPSGNRLTSSNFIISCYFVSLNKMHYQSFRVLNILH
jgi:hypothetical protein